MTRLLLLMLLLPACGGPLALPAGWTAGVCNVENQMACSEGTAYYCRPPNWVRLTGCPEGGCPWQPPGGDGGWEVCR